MSERDWQLPFAARILCEHYSEGGITEEDFINMIFNFGDCLFEVGVMDYDEVMQFIDDNGEMRQ